MPTHGNAITITVDPALGSGDAPYNAAHVVEFDLAQSYEFLREGVGGWIQPLNIGQDIDGIIEGEVTLWLNEEGKLNGLPYNPLADSLCRAAGLMSGDHIVGNVVLTGFDAETGDTIGLTDAQRALLVGRIIDNSAALSIDGRIVAWPAEEQAGTTPFAEPEVERDIRNDRAFSFVWDVGTEGLVTHRYHDEPGTTQAVLTVCHNGRDDRRPYTYGAILSTRTMAADRRSWRATIGVARAERRPMVLIHEQADVKRFSKAGLEAFAQEALAELRDCYQDDELGQDVRPHFQADRLPAHPVSA